MRQLTPQRVYRLNTLAYMIQDCPGKEKTSKELSSNAGKDPCRDLQELCFTITRRGNAAHLLRFVAAMLAVDVV
jgi:hypothetical protein